MEQPSSTLHGKTRRIVGIVCLWLVAVATGSWFYYRFRLNDVPPFQAKALLPVRPMARIMPAPNLSTPGTASPTEPPAAISAPEKSRVHIERDPLDGFRHNMRRLALDELSPAFFDLRTVLEEREGNGGSLQTRRALFQLLDATKTAPPEQRPAILFAADLVATHLGCDDPRPREGLSSDCSELKTDLSRYNLTLKYDELGAGSYYPRDLLWRLWAEYPQSPWGERAFVLLLDRGWDTSFTCEKGGDQTQEVIRQGESFLRQRPGSPYRAVVTLLVAEAYASWWSLSNEPAAGEMSDYVDAKRYQEGAEDARLKAIAHFAEVLQLAPGTDLSQFAGQVLPPLRDRQSFDDYRFLCVYD